MVLNDISALFIGENEISTLSLNGELIWKYEEPYYRITYQLDGGTNSEHNPSSYTRYDDDIILCAATKFQHEFIKWTENGNEISVIQHGSVGDKTLSANYTKTKITVRYYSTYKYTKSTYTNGKSEYLDIKGELTQNSLGKNRDIIKNCVIGSTVSGIGARAFLLCDKMTDVKIPSSVSYIGNWAFQGCTQLKSATIPFGTTTIGIQSFYNCQNMTSIEIPPSVTTIGGLTFYMCNALTSVEMPDSVNFLGANVFKECKNITVTFSNRTLADIKNIEGDGGNKYYPWGLDESQIVPGLK